MPALWLELQPTRAIAAQPRVDASAVTLTLGIEAETRITPARDQAQLPVSRDDCPSCRRRRAASSIGVPIDMPFTEINKIVEAQFAGQDLSGGRLRARSTSP